MSIKSSKRGNNDTLTIERDAFEDIMRTMRELKISLDRKVAEKHRTEELHRRQIQDLSSQLGLEKKVLAKGDIAEQTSSLKEQIRLKDEIRQLRSENRQLNCERQQTSSQDRLTCLLKCQIDQLRKTNSAQLKQIEVLNDKGKEEARLNRLRVASLEEANSTLYKEKQSLQHRLREQDELIQRSQSLQQALTTPLCTSTPKKQVHVPPTLEDRYRRQEITIPEDRPLSSQTFDCKSPSSGVEESVPQSATDLGEVMYQNHSFSEPQPVYTQARKVDTCQQSCGPSVCSREVQVTQIPQSVTDMGEALHNVVRGPNNELPDVRRCTPSLPKEPIASEPLSEKGSQQFITSCRQPQTKDSLDKQGLNFEEDAQCDRQNQGSERKHLEQNNSTDQMACETNKLSKQVKSLKKSMTKLQADLSADDRFKRENEELRAQVSQLHALIDRQALVLRRDRHAFFMEEDSTQSLPRPFESEEFQNLCERTYPEQANSFAEHHESYGDPESSPYTQSRLAVSSCKSGKDSWFDFLDRKEQELLNGKRHNQEETQSDESVVEAKCRRYLQEKVKKKKSLKCIDREEPPVNDTPATQTSDQAGVDSGYAEDMNSCEVRTTLPASNMKELPQTPPKPAVQRTTPVSYVPPRRLR